MAGALSRSLCWHGVCFRRGQPAAIWFAAGAEIPVGLQSRTVGLGLLSVERQRARPLCRTRRQAVGVRHPTAWSLGPLTPSVRHATMPVPDAHCGSRRAMRERAELGSSVVARLGVFCVLDFS
jgi:hypothetical protein